MKYTRIFCLFLLLITTAAVGHAQQFTEPGWFNATIDDSGPISELVSPDEAKSEGYINAPDAIAEAVTPEIQELARGLENDPLRIFRYVHDYIRHVLYFGSKKGAQLTLLERSGNDFDQCALLVALLRAAGHTNTTYQFSLMRMPYESSDHNDLQHWFEFNLPNTDWTTSYNSSAALLLARGYPYVWPSSNSTIEFHRVWVALTIGSTNYYFDPAFKVSEAIIGTNLLTATGLSTNALMTNAAGVLGTGYVDNLTETPLRNKLRDYTTNLLGYLQSNCPNASVEEILGGRRIVPWTNELSQTPLFPRDDLNGVLPLLSWTNLPTSLMTTLAISIGGTNYQWFVPSLQGQRLSLTFDANGLGKLWQEDNLLLQQSTTGGRTVDLTLSIDHPHGQWTTANTLRNSITNDQSVTITYQRTNSTYALLYSFEAGSELLRLRQKKLDAYVQMGLTNTSREVTSETLNVMGLNWMFQTALSEHILARQSDVLTQYHHRLGRMAQEQGRGYYIDAYAQLALDFPEKGRTLEGIGQLSKFLDLAGYFESALEHGIIEQLQTDGLVGASTIKMLQSATAASVPIYLLNSGNWATLKSQLVNYDTNLLQGYINATNTLLLPKDGHRLVAGAGWAGYGLIIKATTGNSSIRLKIEGGYNGGFVSSPSAFVNPPFVYQSSYAAPTYFAPQPPSIPSFHGADPVNMADGSFYINSLDLSIGEAEPKGLAFTRYYNPARRRHNLAGMANGWLHNYYFNLAQISSPEAGLGRSTPAQMASMLVATCAALNLYTTAEDVKKWTVTALIAKWGIDQLIDNGISITMGNDTLEFVKQPDGSYTPPANCTMTLTKTGTTYALKERNKNTFNFDAKGRLTSIVDPYLQDLTFTYLNSTSSLPTLITDWKNRTLTLAYSGTPKHLDSVTDSTGRSIGFSYVANTSGIDLVAVTNVEKAAGTYLYDTNHQIIATKDELNQTITSNIYDGFGRVVEQYTAGDTNRRWRLYWSGYMNTEEDPAGSKRLFYYDEQHRPIGVKDALGNLSQTFYDGHDHAVISISALNETNRMIYDGRNNLVRSIDALNFTNQFSYDSSNRLSQSVDARGKINSFGYNTKHQLTGMTNGAGDWKTFVYSTTDGTLTSQSDPGGTSSFTYDTWGQLKTVISSGSLGTNSFLNSANGDVLSYTNARNFVTSFEYNARRQVTNTIAPTNIITKIAFDAVGNAVSATDARSFVVSNLWSATQKQLATIYPVTAQGTPIVTNIYDNRDWVLRTLNPLQQPTLYTNDIAGRVTSVTDPLLRTSRAVYDAVGRQTQTTNAALEVTRQEWNARGEAVKVIDGAGHTASSVYDEGGNQVTLTNRNGKKWQFQFDAANRLTNTVTPLGRETKLTYDNRGLVSSVKEPSTQSATNNYDAKGRLTNRVDGVATTLYRYDFNDNATNVIELGKSNVWTYDAYDRAVTYRDADNNLLQYRYDPNGNLTNLVYPDSKNVYYAYDSLNRLTNVTDWANRKTSMEYDLANRLKKITRPNNTVRELFYDAAGQTTNIIERMGIGVPIAFFKFNWNSAARMEWEFAAPLPHAYTPPTRVMTYDDDNRLATFNSTAVTNDSDGNITGAPLTNGTFATYTYDARNRLVGTTSTASLTYGYDPTGSRTSITNGTNVTRFIINPNAALSQVLIRGKNGVTNYYVYGLGLLYEADDAGNTKTYHYDCRGSTVALTDGSGIVTDRVEYSAYGTTTYRTGTTDTPFLYNGRYGVQTDSNGLLYMRARYYNPFLCRFINADPSGFSGGLNHYAYADGNPISMSDPFGLGAIAAASSASWLQSQSWYQQTQNLQADARHYGDPNAGRNLAAGFLNVVTLGLAGDVTSATTGYDLYNNRVTSQERILAAASVGLSLIPLERVGLTGARIATRVERVAAGGGANIALGSRFSGLRTFASDIGANHLLDLPNNQWKNVFLSHVENPTTTFHINMGGFFGDTPAEMIMNEMQSGSHTGWELQRLQQAGRLPQANFYQPGQLTPMPNPFIK